MKAISLIFPLILLFAAADLQAQAEMEAEQNDQSELSLITDTPEEGFQVAIQLARKGVTSTQPDRDILFMLREAYSNDPDALIASSQMVAIHFQTIAAANNYWRDEKADE